MLRIGHKKHRIHSELRLFQLVPFVNTCPTLGQGMGAWECSYLARWTNISMQEPLHSKRHSWPWAIGTGLCLKKIEATPLLFSNVHLHSQSLHQVEDFIATNLLRWKSKVYPSAVNCHRNCLWLQPLVKNSQKIATHPCRAESFSVLLLWCLLCLSPSHHYSAVRKIEAVLRRAHSIQMLKESNLFHNGVAIFAPAERCQHLWGVSSSVYTKVVLSINYWHYKSLGIQCCSARLTRGFGLANTKIQYSPASKHSISAENGSFQNVFL